jgi:hypothetical protein
VVDRVRHDIQDRLSLLLGEIDKLRCALTAMVPGGQCASPPPAPSATPATTRRPALTARSNPPVPRTAAGRTARAQRACGILAHATRPDPGDGAGGAVARAAADRRRDLGATGLVRPTVSTTFPGWPRPARPHADRGYELPADPAEAPIRAKPAIATASPPGIVTRADGRLGASRPPTPTHGAPVAADAPPGARRLLAAPLSPTQL